MADNNIYENAFYNFQEEPTKDKYFWLVNVLCKMNELWFITRVAFENAHKSAIILLKNSADLRVDILVTNDGTRLYPIFTSAENAIEYSKKYPSDYNIAIGKTTIENVLKIMENDKTVNATHIVVNYLHETQVELNKNAIEIARDFIAQNIKEKAESNDEQYKEGRKCNEEAYKLHFGIGAKKDKVAALELYTRTAQLFQASAERGNKQAMYDLGLLIRNGHGVEQDFDKAAYWLRQSVMDCDKDEKERIEKAIAEFKFYKDKNKK